MGNEMQSNPILPRTLNPQQNKSSSTAGKMTGTMRLIMKAKENNRMGISNYDSVVVCEFCKGEEVDPVVLLAVDVHLKILLQDLVDVFGLPIGLRVVAC